VEITFKAKTNKLDKLIRKLNDTKTLCVEVGILGPQARQIHPSTAEDEKKYPVGRIGRIHEYGEPKVNIPERSFLRWPIWDDLFWSLVQRYQGKSIVWNLLFERANFAAMLGATAVQVVQDAFDRGGSTKRTWKALNPKYARTKTTQQILVETETLRRSIGFRMGENA
jgi:phage gpG-like protein